MNNKFNGETHNNLPILGSMRLSKKTITEKTKHFNFSLGIIIGKFSNSMIWIFSLEVFYFALKNNWSQIFLFNAKIFQKTKLFRVQISLGTNQETEPIFH